jgi:hypothetical protein
MSPTIDELLVEFETLSLDERVYLVMRSDEDLEVCIHFQRKDAPKCWSVWYKLSEEASRQQCSRQSFPLVLRAFQVADGTFITELSNRLLTQAAFADEFVRSVSALLGAEAVRESIRATQAFMENLRALVQRTLGPGPGTEGAESKITPPRLTTLKSLDGGTEARPAKGHLRVIRPKRDDE